MTAAIDPTIEEIIDSVLAPKTRSQYRTYINRYVDFCHRNNYDIDNPEYNDLVDYIAAYFHFLKIDMALGTGVISQAKSALVFLYKKKRRQPNPAQSTQAKDYVNGNIRRNKRLGLDVEKKAYPLKAAELNQILITMMYLPEFSRYYYSLMFVMCYLGCFRIGEVLNLRWQDVGLGRNTNGIEYVVVRLTWHKTAGTLSGSKIYKLYDEDGVAHLNIVQVFKNFKNFIEQSFTRIDQAGILFSTFKYDSNNGAVVINRYHKQQPPLIMSLLDELADRNCSIPEYISLHSFRRGGAAFRVFDSPFKKFDYNQLMAWCRWTNIPTMLSYLVSLKISEDIETTTLLDPSMHNVMNQISATDDVNYELLAQMVFSIYLG
jgi:integrase